MPLTWSVLHLLSSLRGEVLVLKPLLTYLSPLLRAMPMSFSMPPASRRALVFSMFLVMTSCSAQQMAVTVSSDMALLGGPVVPEVPLLVELWLLLLLLPGSRWIKSLMAYLPGGKRILIKVLFPSHFSHIWLILQSNSLRKLCVVVRVYIFYDSSYTHAKG